MVWMLSPVDNASGFRPFYFLAAREYTIGRKDGDIVIANEASISRLHAKLILKEPPPWLPQSQTAVPRPELWLKDLSKVGTFLNKSPGSLPISSQPDGKAFLHEGVVITFGLARVTFRLTFLPWVVCLSPALDANLKVTATHAAKLAGIYVVEEWVDACSHLVEQDGGLATHVTWEAVTASKPVVTIQWLQAVAARQSVGVPLPSPASFAPLLRATPNSGAVPVAGRDARMVMLAGTTFCLAQSATYHKQLKGLLQAAGASVEFISNAKLAGRRNTEVLIVPTGEAVAWLTEGLAASVKGMRRVGEASLLAAVLSGQLDWPSILEAAEEAASESTQDTTDGPDMLDTAHQSVDSQWMSSARVHITQVSLQSMDVADVALPLETTDGPSMILDPSPVQPQRTSRRFSRAQPVLSESRPLQPRVEEEACGATTNGSASQAQEPPADADVAAVGPSSQADVIFKPLIVKCVAAASAAAPSRSQTSASGCPSGSGPPNFKAFRKTNPAGEQRLIVVPFSREPYREVDGLRPEVEAYVQSERKRQEAEKISDDLFHADKLKRQRAAPNSMADDTQMPPPKARGRR